MKLQTTILLIILTASILLSNDSDNSLQKEEFEDYKIEFKEEIENLNFKLDSIKEQINTVKTDIDTLKAGQIVIYNEVKKKSVSFLRKLQTFYIK